MGSLIVVGRKYNFEDIAYGRCKPDQSSRFIKEVVDFIRQWYRPQASFNIRTSGSTGLPRVISIPKTAMEESAKLTALALGLNSGITSLLAMNPNYIGGKMMIARTLTLDMDLVVTEPTSNPFHELDSNKEIDFAALVPLQVTTIIEQGFIQSLNDLQVLLIGGGIIPQGLLEKIKQLKVPTYQSYGMTETVSHVALRRLNGKWEDPWYHAIPGFEFGMDSRGCLKVSGAFLSKEVVTNDVIDWKTPSSFEWLGRIDNVINSGGIKIQAEFVERKILEVLRDHNLPVIHFIAGGIPDYKLGEKLVLFVEGNSGEEGEKILQAVKGSMDPHLVPKVVIPLISFDYTETGKIRRQHTIKRYLSLKE